MRDDRAELHGLAQRLDDSQDLGHLRAVPQHRRAELHSPLGELDERAREVDDALLLDEVADEEKVRGAGGNPGRRLERGGITRSEALGVDPHVGDDELAPRHLRDAEVLGEALGEELRHHDDAARRTKRPRDERPPGPDRPREDVGAVSGEDERLSPQTGGNEREGGYGHQVVGVHDVVAAQNRRREGLPQQPRVLREVRHTLSAPRGCDELDLDSEAIGQFALLPLNERSVAGLLGRRVHVREHEDPKRPLGRCPAHEAFLRASRLRNTRA